MRRFAAWLTLLVAAPVTISAQASTAEALHQAQDLYERLEIERAVPLLRQVVSPGWAFEVTQDQRVQAYTYLGASLALLGARDSAVLYFRSAIERVRGDGRMRATITRGGPMAHAPVVIIIGATGLAREKGITNADRALQDIVRGFQTEGAPKVTHLIAAEPDSSA